MKAKYLPFLAMLGLTLPTGSAALLRAEPALECGSGAAALDWGAYSAAGKAVAPLPHSKVRTFGPHPLEWGEGVARPAFSSAGARRVRGHFAPAAQKVNRPKPLPNRRQASPAGNSMNLGQPGSIGSAAVAKSGFVRGETVNNTLAARAPSTVRPTAPSFTNVRHRSPNAAIVAGAPNSRSSNAAALNGTRMNRRP